jgi:hypothetical protein
MRYRTMLTALIRIVEGDFTSVRKKFLDQDVDENDLDQYIADFKKLKDQNRIGKVEDRNIDNWGKKPFEKFQEFIDRLKSERSMTKQRKLKKMEGAELRAENDDWRVYKITTHEAAMIYGSGTRWCITKYDGEDWREISFDNDFYFLISKNRPKDDPWYKIALQVDRDGSKIYWDAPDESHKEDSIEAAELNIPDFDVDEVEVKTNPGELKERLEDFIQREEELAREDDYPRDQVTDQANWDTGNLSDELQRLIERLMDLAEEMDEDWTEIVEEHSDVEMIDWDDEPDNALAEYTIENIEVMPDEELADMIAGMDEKDVEQILKDIGDQYSFVGGYLTFPVNFRWIYAVYLNDLEMAVNQMELEKKWKETPPTQEDMAEAYEEHDLTGAYRNYTILPKISDEKLLARIYRNSPYDRKVIAQKIKNPEIIKSLLEDEDLEIQLHDMKDLFDKLKDDKDYLRKYFTSHALSAVRRMMIDQGYVTDDALVASAIRQELEKDKPDAHVIDDLAKHLSFETYQNETYQNLLKKAAESVPAMYNSTLIGKISDKKWLWESFMRAYKFKKENPEEPVTLYRQLLGRLMDLALTDDALAQKLEELPDLDRVDKERLIRTSRNKTWLKAIMEKHLSDDRDDDSYGLYRLARGRLAELERRGR